MGLYRSFEGQKERYRNRKKGNGAFWQDRFQRKA